MHCRCVCIPRKAASSAWHKKDPATLVIFDCLLRKLRQPLLKRPFEERRAALEAFFEEHRRAFGLAVTPLRATCAKQNDGSTTYSYPLTVS